MLRAWPIVLVASALVPSAPARADDAEDKAAAFVEKLGGSVTRDEKRPGNPVVRVNLSQSKVTDADLRFLAPLQSVTSLDLSLTGISDAGLKELAALPNLRWLDLQHWSVSREHSQRCSATRRRCPRPQKTRTSNVYRCKACYPA